MQRMLPILSNKIVVKIDIMYLCKNNLLEFS
jgi:hypothetical protein